MQLAYASLVRMSKVTEDDDSYRNFLRCNFRRGSERRVAYVALLRLREMIVVDGGMT